MRFTLYCLVGSAIVFALILIVLIIFPVLEPEQIALIVVFYSAVIGICLYYKEEIALKVFLSVLFLNLTALGLILFDWWPWGIYFSLSALVFAVYKSKTAKAKIEKIEKNASGKGEK